MDYVSIDIIHIPAVVLVQDQDSCYSLKNTTSVLGYHDYRTDTPVTVD